MRVSGGVAGHGESEADAFALVAGLRRASPLTDLALGAGQPLLYRSNDLVGEAHWGVHEGALRFWIGEDEKEEVVVKAGEVLRIPSNVPHKAEALEDTLDVDVFSPPREDWLNKTDSYLRR